MSLVEQGRKNNYNEFRLGLFRRYIDTVRDDPAKPVSLPDLVSQVIEDAKKLRLWGEAENNISSLDLLPEAYVMNHPQFEFCPARSQLKRVDSSVVHLSEREARLLHKLMSHRGYVVPHEILWQAMGFVAVTANDGCNNLRTYINYLRHKIGDTKITENGKGNWRFIKTAPWKGYFLSEEE